MSLEVNYIDDISLEELELSSESLAQLSVEEKVRSAIESALRPLAQGNEAYVRVEELEVTPPRVKANILIRHKHTTKIPFDGKVTIYAAQTYVKIDTDVTNPDPNDVKTCINTPVGQICITLADLIKALAVILA